MTVQENRRWRARHAVAGLILFAISFGYVEAAVVVYLRTLYEPLRRPLASDGAEGELFPLITQDRLRTQPPAISRLLPAEVGREAATLLMLALVAFGLTALGYVIAWKMDSTQGFHAIMNLFLIPMWLLCGAVFPASGAPGWLRVVMEVNPLTYGMSAVRWSIYGSDVASRMGIPGFGLSVGITVAFAAIVFSAAISMTRRPA